MKEIMKRRKREREKEREMRKHEIYRRKYIR